MKLQKAAEDYLETMLMLKEEKGFIRSIDIAQHLGVTKPSVTYATKRLKESGHITMGPDGMITLTEQGLDIARGVYDRHRVLAKLLIRLGVSPETARADACRMEHDISEETFRALCRHASQYENQGSET